MYSFEDIFADKEKILFVMAHPDDVDVFFGGTLCRLRKENKDVKVVVVTSGARGSKDKEITEVDLGKRRFEEEKEALSILGLDSRNLGTLNYLDGEVENNMRLIADLAREIRSFRPQIICTHNPTGFYYPLSKHSGYSHLNHRDHRNSGLSVLDAVYPFSRDRSFFKEQIVVGLSPHSVYEIVLTGESGANTQLKITEVVDQKRQALLAHKSQFSQKDVEEIVEEFKEENNHFEPAVYLKLAW